VQTRISTITITKRSLRRNKKRKIEADLKNKTGWEDVR